MTIYDEAKNYVESLVLSGGYSDVVSLLQGNDTILIKEYLQYGTINGTYPVGAPEEPGKYILYYKEDETDLFSTTAIDICLSVFVTGKYSTSNQTAYDLYQSKLVEKAYGNQGFGLPEQMRKHMWDNEIFIIETPLEAARLANQRIEVWSGESTVKRLKDEIEQALDKSKTVAQVVTDIGNLLTSNTSDFAKFFNADVEELITRYRGQAAEIAQSQLGVIIRQEVPPLIEQVKAAINQKVEEVVDQDISSIADEIETIIDDTNDELAQKIYDNIIEYRDLFPGEISIEGIVTVQSIKSLLSSSYTDVARDYASDVVDIHNLYEDGLISIDVYKERLSGKAGFYLNQVVTQMHESVDETIQAYADEGLNGLIEIIFRGDLAALLASGLLDYEALAEEERLIAETLVTDTNAGNLGDSEEEVYDTYSIYDVSNKIKDLLGNLVSGTSNTEDGWTINNSRKLALAAFGDEDISTARWDSFSRAFSQINTDSINELGDNAFEVIYDKLLTSGLLDLASQAYEISRFAQRRMTSISALGQSADFFLDPSEDVYWLQSLAVSVSRIKSDPIAFTTIAYYIPSLTTLLIDAIAIVNEYGDGNQAYGNYIDSLEKAFGIGENGKQVFEMAFKLENTTRKIRNVLESSPYRTNISPESPDIFHLRLGAANFYVPPISIDVNTQFKTGSLTGGAIRQRNTPKFNSGHKETSIRLNLFFPNYQEIWGVSLDSDTSISLNEDMKIDFKAGGSDEKVIDKFLSSLRGLVAAFKYSPILPIKNHYLNSVHGISAVCLNNISINTVPNYPFTLSVQLELLNFNHKPFLPMISDFNQSIHWGKYRQYMGKAATNLHKYVNENFLMKTSDSKDVDQADPDNGFDITRIGTPVEDDPSSIPPYIAAPQPQNNPADNFDVLSTNIIKQWQDGRHISFFVPAEAQTKIFLPSTASFRSEQESLLTDSGESVWRRILKGFGIDITEAAGYGLSLNEAVDVSRNRIYQAKYKDLILDSIDILIAPLGASSSSEQVFSFLIESFISENRFNSILDGDREEWLREYLNGSGVIDLTQYQDPGPWRFQNKILQNSDGDNANLSLCKEIIYRISENPSSFLDYLVDKEVQEIKDTTGSDPDELKVREEILNAFNATVYERFFQSGPIQAYLEALRNRNAAYQFNEWEVPMIEVSLDPDSVIIDSVNVSMSNNFAKMQVQLMDEPTYQHIGGGDSFVSISMTVIGNGNDESELKKLKRMFDHLSGLARLEHSSGVLGFMGIKNVITALSGIKYVLPMSFNVSTAPNYPHIYKVNLTLSDFDIFQQKREKLSSTQQKEMIEHFSSKKNPFLRIKQMWGSFNAYPDFPLSVVNSDGEIVGNLDPDFYFRAFETYDQDIINGISEQKALTSTSAINTPSAGQLIEDEIEMAKIEFDFIQFARRYSPTSSNEDLFNEIKEYVIGLSIDRESILYILNEKVALKNTKDLSAEDKGQFISEFITFADDVSEDSIFTERDGTGFMLGDHVFSDQKSIQQIKAVLSGEYSLQSENYISFNPDEVEFHKIIVAVPTGNRQEIETGHTPSIMMTAIGNYYGYMDSKSGRFYLTNGEGGDLMVKDTESGASLLNPNPLIDVQTPDNGNTVVNSGVPGAKAISEYQNAYDTDEYTHWEKMLVDTQYRDNTGRMLRAFPTYMLWLIDEGGNFAGVKLFDNFYGLQSVIDFSVVSSEDIMADTLIFRLSNLYSKLTTNEAEEMFSSYLDGSNEMLDLNAGVEMSIDRVLNLARNVRGHMSNEYVVNIENIRLKPGVRVHLRAGYGANPNSLQTLFNGVITEVEQGEIVTVTAQSDAVELSGMINSTNKKGDSGKIDGGIDTGFWMSEPRDLMVRLLSMGAGRVRENIARATRGTVFSENRFGIRHFGNILYEPLTRQESEKQKAMYNSVSSALNGISSGRIGGGNLRDVAGTAAVSTVVTSALAGSSTLAAGGMAAFSGYRAYSSIKENTGLSITGVIGGLLGRSMNQPDLEVFKRNIYPGNGTGIAQFLGGDLDDGWSTVASLTTADAFDVAGSSATAMLTDTAWNKLLIQTQKNNPGANRALDDLTSDYTLNTSSKDEVVSGIFSVSLGAALGGPIGAIASPIPGMGLLGAIRGRGGRNFFRTMGIISPNEDDDIPGADEVSFRAQTYMRTVWDMFQTCARLLPNYIVAVRPFEDRSTIFYGKPHWLYTSGVLPVTTGYPGDEKAMELGILDKVPRIKSPDYELSSILTEINKSTNRYADYSAFLSMSEVSDSYEKIGQDIANSSGVYEPTGYLNGKILDFNSQFARAHFDTETGEPISLMPTSKGSVYVGYHIPIDPEGKSTIVSYDQMSALHTQITNLPPRYSFPYFVDSVGVQGVSELKNNSTITIQTDETDLYSILKDVEKDFFKDNEEFSLFLKNEEGPEGLFGGLGDLAGGILDITGGVVEGTLDFAGDVLATIEPIGAVDKLIGWVPIVGDVTGAINDGVDWAIEKGLGSIGNVADGIMTGGGMAIDFALDGVQKLWDGKWDYSEGFKETVVLDKFIDFSSAMRNAQAKLIEEKVAIPVYTTMPIPSAQVDFVDARSYNPDSIDFTNLRLFNSYGKDWPAVKSSKHEQFYIAMKWPYIPSADSATVEIFKNKYFPNQEIAGTAEEYRNRKVLVFNPNNGRAVVCAPAYFLWGDAEYDAVVSPDAAYYLSILTEINSEGNGGFRDNPEAQECYMAFVPDDTPLGSIAPQNVPILSFTEVVSGDPSAVPGNQASAIIGFGPWQSLSGDQLLAEKVPINNTNAGSFPTPYVGVLNNSLETYQPYNAAVAPSYNKLLFGGNPIIDGETYFNIVVNNSLDQLEDINMSTDEENRETLSAVYDPMDLVSIKARSFYDEKFDPSVTVIAGNGRTVQDAQKIWNQFRAEYHTYDSVKKIFEDVYGISADSDDELPIYLQRAINSNQDNPIVSNFATNDGTALDEFALLLGQDYINNLEGRAGTSPVQTSAQELRDAIEFARTNFIDAPADENGLIASINNLVKNKLASIREIFLSQSAIKTLVQIEYEKSLTQAINDNPDINLSAVDADGNPVIQDPDNQDILNGITRSISEELIQEKIDNIRTPKQLFLFMVGSFRQKLWEDPYSRAWLVLKPDFRAFLSDGGIIDKLTNAVTLGRLDVSDTQWSFKPVDAIFRAYISPYGDYAKPSNKDKFLSLLASTASEGNSATNPLNWALSEASNAIESFWDATIGPIYSAIADGLSALLAQFKLSMGQLGYAVSEGAAFRQQANVLNKALNDSIYYSLGTENSILRKVDNPFTREYGEPVVEIREPFQRIHYISSFTHILSNQIQETINNVPTVITAVSDGKYPVTVAMDKGAPSERQVEKTIETGIFFDNAIGEGALAFIHPILHPLQTARGFTKAASGVPDEMSAKRIALSHLRDSVKDIYGGELIVTGNPDIRPYDLVYLSDVYERMYGIFEVEQVVHHFTPEMGFITSITPNALVTVNDPIRWTLLSTVSSFMSKQVLRNDTRIILDQLRSSNAGVAVGGNVSMDALSELLTPQLVGGIQYTNGSSALMKDLMALELAKKAPDVSAEMQKLLGSQGSKADLFALMGSVAVGGAVAAAGAALTATGVGAPVGLAIAAAGGIASKMIWSGWTYIKDNLLDQHGCYVQYLNRNGQPMDAGLSYNQGMVVGSYHSKAILPGILGTRVKMRTPEGNAFVRTDDLFKSLGWKETEIDDFVRYASYQNALVHAEVLQLAGLGPEKAGLEPQFKVIAKCIKVKDGDTITVEDVISGVQFDVRFDGINTSEINKIEGRVVIPENSESANLSIVDLTAPAGQATVYTQNALKDKIILLRINESRSVDGSASSAILNEDYDAGNTQNNVSNYQADKFDRIIGTIFYKLPDSNIDTHKGYINQIFRDNIDAPDHIRLIKNSVKNDIIDESPFNKFFDRIYNSLIDSVIPNYYTIASDSSDPIANLPPSDQDVYSVLVRIKMLEEIYSTVSRWPYVSWDEYYEDGTPYTLNWELVVNNLARVYVKDLQNESQSVLNANETVPIPTRVGT